MPTQLKSDTARENGAKSQGPKTAEGRAKSSQNAVKHGLSSRNPVVLECENDDDFQALHDNQMEVHQPATPAEQDLVDQMVVARWRILRLQSIESDLLDTELRRKKEIERRLDRGRRVQLSAAYTEQANDSRAMALASRCESRLQRTYQSLYKILRDLQASRATASTRPERPAEAANSQPAEKKYDNKPKAAIISFASGAVNPSDPAKASAAPDAGEAREAPPGNRHSDASL